MPGGSCQSLLELPETAAAVIRDARRAVLSTLDPQGRPHAVPVCFALRDGEIVSAVDTKPKGARRLGRLRNVEANPSVAVLFDRWEEDWSRLGWVMARGSARIDAPGSAQRQLAARYPQYADSPPPGEVIAVRVERVTWWSWV